jgi:hypothetical protein
MSENDSQTEGGTMGMSLKSEFRSSFVKTSEMLEVADQVLTDTGIFNDSPRDGRGFKDSRYVVALLGSGRSQFEMLMVRPDGLEA